MCIRDRVSNAWRVFHSEGDGISGLVIDRYDDLLVVGFFSAGAWRHRDIIFNVLREAFPGCRFHSFADEHVQKQESFDYRDTQGTEPAVITPRGPRRSSHRPTGMPTRAAMSWLADNAAVIAAVGQPVVAEMSPARTGKA